MNFESKLPEGVIAATLTPMNKDLSVNYKALVQHLQWLLDNGCDGICLLGTTGEANSFSLRERMDIIDMVVDWGIDPTKLLIGTGSCAFTDTVTLTKHALTKGAGGILMLPPFYYKNVSDEGILDYFKLVISEVNDPNLRIYLYHFPKMSAVPFSLDLTRKLVEAHPGIIVGMKDSSGDWENMKAISESLPGFKLYAGTEKYLLENLKMGGAGTISASANATSKLCAKVLKDWRSGGNNSEELQEQLTNARHASEAAPFVGGLKYMFSKWTKDQDWLNVRPPNTLPNEQERVKLDEISLDVD